MSELIIRESLGLDDVESVHRLVPEIGTLNENLPYPYWDMLNYFADSCLIAEDNGQPAGFVISHPIHTHKPKGALRPIRLAKPEWFIWQIGVLPEYRGQGVSDKLLDGVVVAARSYGAVALRATIEENNPFSYALFQRLAVRLGSSMEEGERFRLYNAAPGSPREVEYRIGL